MGEVIFIIGLVGGLILPFLLLTGWGRKYWFITMSVIGLTLGASEIIAVVHTGGTISQMYWQWSVNHVSTHWIVIGCLALGWLALLWHLSAKVLSGKAYNKKFKTDEEE